MPIRMKERDPLARLGGKSQLIETLSRIVEQACEDHNLVGVLDLFMGGCRMFLHLDYNIKIEIKAATEIDRGIVNLFRVLQDSHKIDQLIHYIWKTADQITTEAKFKEANIKRLSTNISELESAGLTYVVSKFSHAADMQGFVQKNADEGIDPKSLDKFLHLENVIGDVEIIEGDYKKLYDKYSHRSDILAWYDPPYLRDKGEQKNEVESTRSYIHPFNPEDQEMLIDNAIDSPNKTIISGYDNAAYKRLEENGFQKYFIGLVNVPSSSSGKKIKEFIWIKNFEIDESTLPVEPNDNEF